MTVLLPFCNFGSTQRGMSHLKNSYLSQHFDILLKWINFTLKFIIESCLSVSRETLLSSSLEQLCGSSILLSNRCHMYFVFRKNCRSFNLTIHLRLLAESRFRGALHFRHLYTIVNLFLGTAIAVYLTLKRFLLFVIPTPLNSSYILSHILASRRKLIVWPRYCHSVFLKAPGSSVQSLILLGWGKVVPVAARSYGVGLRPPACWDRWFELHRGHGCLSVVECCVLCVVR